jgi:aryl-alcohol dehydrogenase-like predicted oxidoreductase
MFYRPLGATGIELPALTLGAWSIGPLQSFAADKTSAIGAIRKGYELGCHTFDTAPGYGFGYSEEVLAEAMEGVPRDRINILTKCGVIPGGGRGRLQSQMEHEGKKLDIYIYSGKESVIQECEGSLRRLKTDYIDLYSVHRYDPTTPLAELAEAFELLLRQGKIRAAGVCNYTFEQMQDAEKYFPVASIKTTYSMLNRPIENDLVPYCLGHNKGILAYSVLQRGILTGRNYPKFLRDVDENSSEAALYDPENMEKIRGFLDTITPLAEDKGVEVTHICLRWAIEQPGITTGLIQASNAEQVKDDFKALDISFTVEDKTFIDRHLNALLDRLEFSPATIG